MTYAQEQENIMRVLSGDKAAFEALVLVNQQAVYNLALRMTGNPQDALDVSQETFIRAYTHLSSFRGESRFSVWLYRMTYNICIDHARKNSRAATVPLETRDEDGEVTVMEIPDVRSLPEDRAERAELIRAVSAAVDRLSPEHRQVLIMREQAGMSYDEIAQVLDLSVGTVKSRINRARRTLADFLVKDGTFSAAPSSYKGKEVE